MVDSTDKETAHPVSFGSRECALGATSLGRNTFAGHVTSAPARVYVKLPAAKWSRLDNTLRVSSDKRGIRRKIDRYWHT